MKLTRKQKILRNFLICMLLCLGIHAAMGFPPYTVEGMCRQVARDYLLPELEPIYVLKEKHEYSGDIFKRTYTYVIARCEDYYLSFLYDRDLLLNEREYAAGVEMKKGSLCTARKGMMYLAGDFDAVDAAEMVVTATNGTDTRDFHFTGERLADDLFGFRYSEGDGFWFRLDEIPAEEMDLGEIAQYWYRTPHGNNGYSYDHAELPVMATLYDAAGNALETIETSIGTYDLHLWF